MTLNLEQVKGFNVRVTSVIDDSYEGTIYCVNSRNNTITIQNGPHSFKILQNNFIKKLEVLNKPDKNGGINKIALPQYINIDRLNKIIDKNLIDEKNNNILGKDGLKIFNNLKKTLNDTRLVKDKIIVLDDVIIEAPYHVDNVSGSNESGVELVKRIIEGVWQRKGG